MIEKQFAEFLTQQMKSKVSVLEHESNHPAVKELKIYID